jgi:hypothetical protein
MLKVLARLTLWIIKWNVLCLWFSGTPYTGKRSDKVIHPFSPPAIDLIRDLLTDFCLRCRFESAGASRKNICLRSGGSEWHSIPSQAPMLPKANLLTHMSLGGRWAHKELQQARKDARDWETRISARGKNDILQDSGFNFYLTLFSGVPPEA